MLSLFIYIGKVWAVAVYCLLSQYSIAFIMALGCTDALLHANHISSPSIVLRYRDGAIYCSARL